MVDQDPILADDVTYIKTVNLELIIVIMIMSNGKQIDVTTRYQFVCLAPCQLHAVILHIREYQANTFSGSYRTVMAENSRFNVQGLEDAQSKQHESYSQRFL